MLYILSGLDFKIQIPGRLVDCCDQNYATIVSYVVSLYGTYLGSQCSSVDNPFMISSDVNQRCGGALVSVVV